MKPEFHFTESEIHSMGIEAACRKAYERGRADGGHAAFLAGQHFGVLTVHQAVADASDVVNVYRNGDHTVLAFADGTKTRVTYRPDYGYGYDDEKAIMAAMLKRLTGNDYIRVLKKFVRHEHDADCVCECPGPEHRRNVSRRMIRRHKPSPLDVPTTDPVAAALAEIQTDDAELWQEFHTMPDEPSLTAGVTTDPVAMAMAQAPADDDDASDDILFPDTCDGPSSGASTDPVASALESAAVCGS